MTMLTGKSRSVTTKNGKTISPMNPHSQFQADLKRNGSKQASHQELVGALIMARRIVVIKSGWLVLFFFNIFIL